MVILIFLSWFSLCFASDRSSSAPYISGDTFRAHADFVIEEKKAPFFPEKVTPGSTVFVKTDCLSYFFKKLHPSIRSPYILITHNSDRPIPGAFAHMLEDDKLIAWFGINIENCVHPKLHPIPIGLANKYCAHGNTEIFDQVKGEAKSFLLYMNFSVATYDKERSKLYERFIKQPFCVASPFKDLKPYLLDLAKAKFVLSPRGNGLDCHRTWEALYMRAIPIVQTSSLDPLYKDLPVVIVKDWSEVTEAFLEKKHEELQKQTYQWDKLQIAYWLKCIKTCTCPQP